MCIRIDFCGVVRIKAFKIYLNDLSQNIRTLGINSTMKNYFEEFLTMKSIYQ